MGIFFQKGIIFKFIFKIVNTKHLIFYETELKGFFLLN